MNFIQATKLAEEGHDIQRPYWGYSSVTRHKKGLVWTANGTAYTPTIDDILAEDWQLDEEEEEEEETP